MAIAASENGALMVSYIIHCNNNLEQFAVVQYIIKITRFYIIMASITDTNLIQTLFRCTQTVDKSPTKAIWIIYIILAESRTRRALPIRIQTLMSIQINFQSQLPKCVSMIG